MASAKTVANYLLSLSQPEEGDLISHLKLQKLLYYSQGFHLAMHGVVLFPDRIYHWKHGPVVESIFHDFKSYGSGEIPPPTNANFSELTQSQRELLNEVYNVYGQFSAWKLREMTHNEPPWAETRDQQEITPERLAAYFQTQLIA